MARKTKTNTKKKFSYKTGKAKKTPKGQGVNRKSVLLSFLSICVIIALGIMFLPLKNYVKSNNRTSNKRLSLEIVMPPDWINEPIKQMIYAAATANGEDLRPDEDTARTVQKNLEESFFWIKDVRVQVTGETIRIEGGWREPLALFESEGEKYYLDEELMVLGHVPIKEFTVVKIAGFSSKTALPGPGRVLSNDDIASGVEVLVQLRQMDRGVTPDKPLLNEIDRIDVSNFKGRKSKSKPHIVLYTVDDTEILWGAEIGAWQRNLESTDEEKIAKLYNYYQKGGSLLKGVKFINLRDPKSNIPQPIDKY